MKFLQYWQIKYWTNLYPRHVVMNYKVLAQLPNIALFAFVGLSLDSFNLLSLSNYSSPDLSLLRMRSAPSSHRHRRHRSILQFRRNENAVLCWILASQLLDRFRFQTKMPTLLHVCFMCSEFPRRFTSVASDTLFHSFCIGNNDNNSIGNNNNNCSVLFDYNVLICIWLLVL